MKRLPALLVLLAAILAVALPSLLSGGGTSPRDCRAVYGETSHRLAIKQGLACPKKGLRPSTAAGIPTVEQFDSVTLSTVPSSAHYVAGYVNGAWPTYYQMKGRWPVVVGIAVSRSAGADCIDLEPGNPGPDAAGPWVRWQISQGNAVPCVYSMLSWMSAIKANLAAYGLSRSQYRLWDANWTYSPHLDAGYDCTQWTDHSRGLNLDESSCATSFYGPPPDPYAIYPKTVFTFGTISASEYADVKRWDAFKCHNPVRRGICVHDREHLSLLAGRLWYVAHHRRLGGPATPVDWSTGSRGARFQGIWHRLGH